MALGLGGDVVARIKAVVEVDSSGVGSGLRDAEQQTSKAKKGFGTLTKAVGALGLGFAAIKVAGAVWGDFLEGQKNAAQTAQVLKTTGGVAHVSAKQVGELASAIQAKSGMDDDAIQSGENLLLTFKNIRNEGGKGNDIFSQTTGLMADMSQAMGQDTKSSALQLGKALNDPVKGISALSRVGITFDAGQKKQIETMVKHGNVLGAQKIMLAEVRSEVGGSAEAYGKTLPGMIDRAKQATISFLSDGLAKLVPYIMQGIEWLTKFAQSKQFAEWMDKTKHAVMVFVDDVVRTWHTLQPVIVPVVHVIIRNIKRIADVVADVARLVDALIHGKWSDAWNQLKHLVSDVVKAVVGYIRDMGSLALQALGHLKDKAVEKAKDIGRGIRDGITGFLGGIGDSLAGAVKGAINALIGAANRGLNVIHDHWPDVPGAPGPPFGHDPIPKLATGALIKGSAQGRDSVLALVAPGEMVINTRQQGRLARLLGMDGNGELRGTNGPAEIHVHQTIIASTADQGVHMRQAKFAAQAAFG